MKAVLAFAFAILIVAEAMFPFQGFFNVPTPSLVQNVPDTVYQAINADTLINSRSDVVTSSTQCLFEQCGPESGMITMLCNTFCSATGCGNGRCSFTNGAAQCTCDKSNPFASLALLLCQRPCSDSCRGCTLSGVSGGRSGKCFMLSDNRGLTCTCS